MRYSQTSKPPLGSLINFSHPLAKGLVACWLMNEGSGNRIADVSGNNNGGVLTNGPLWVPGRSGPTLSFEGTDDYVLLTFAPNINYARPNTFSAWVYSTTTAAQKTIISTKTDTNNNANFAISSSGIVALYYKSGGTDYGGYKATVYSANTWTHLCGVFNGTTVKIYKNAVDVGSVLGSGTSGPTNTIGQLGNSSQYWNGFLDDIRIYNRELTTKEIWQLYATPYAMFEHRPVWMGYVAAGGLSIIPSGIASGQSIGTHQLNRYILASGIASAQAIGTFGVNRYLLPTGVASGQAFGTSQLNRYITTTGVATGESFGTAKTIFTVSPTGISSSETLGSATLNFVIFPSGVASRESIGAHLISVSGGPLVILPGGITTSELFGTHKFNRYILPSGISSLQNFGTAKLIEYLLPTGISSAQVLGLNKLNFIIFPSGITSNESIGSHLISTTGGALIIVPVGIATAQLFGTGKLNLFISATGLGSTESFGIHKINEYINPTGISTGESIGQIIIVGPKTILPVGIVSGETWGTIVVTIPYTKDWNELKAKIIYLLRTDTILRGLLNKSTSPYGVYFSRPPVKPSFPLLTVRFIDEAMDVENNPQPRTIYVEFKAYSATNSDAILERVEEVINQSVNFREMTEYKVSHAALDSIGPDDFDANFNIYTGSHQYVFFVDHHQRESWS